MSSSPRRIAARRSSLGAFALLGFAACVLWAKPMGLLFWARIRILTNIPRTAIADDPQVLAAENSPRISAGEVALDSTPLALPARPSRNPFAPISRDKPRD